MRGHELVVDAGAVVETFDVRTRHHLDEMLVAREGLGKQDDAVAGLINSTVFKEASTGCEVSIEANDRLDSGIACRFVEVDDAIERTVVGKCHRSLAIGLGGSNELLGGWDSVEEGVV